MPFTDLIEAQRRIEQQIAALTEAQQNTNYRLDTLTNDMAEVKDILFELWYRDRAHAYFAPLIRRTHVLSPEELDALLEGAVAQGQLSEAEADEILLADLLLRGRRRADNAEVYVVVEISWKIDPYDVERSVRRAALLSRLGTPARPSGRRQGGHRRSGQLGKHAPRLAADQWPGETPPPAWQWQRSLYPPRISLASGSAHPYR